MREIAAIIWAAATDFDGKQAALRDRVAALTEKYPLYEG